MKQEEFASLLRCCVDMNISFEERMGAKTILRNAGFSDAVSIAMKAHDNEVKKKIKDAVGPFMGRRLELLIKELAKGVVDD